MRPEMMKPAPRASYPNHRDEYARLKRVGAQQDAGRRASQHRAGHCHRQGQMARTKHESTDQPRQTALFRWLGRT